MDEIIVRFSLSRADIRLKIGDNRAVIPDFYPVMPTFQPRHSREGGNPDCFSQARHLKSGANGERQIPSPLMGEG